MKRISIFMTLILIISLFTGCSVADISNISPTPDIQNTTTTSATPTPISTNTNISGELQVYFFDVGQADCSLTIFPTGETLLIDGGNNEDGGFLVSQIKSLGINNISYLVGTHPHEDHIGGLDTIIQNFDIGKIYMPNAYSDSRTFEEVVNAISNKGMKITAPVSGEYIMNTTDSKIRILAPNSKEYDNLNNYSIAIRVDYKDNSFLFTGDAETEVENEILAKGYDIDVDVFKAGHHGSTTSNSSRFLNKVTPEYVIIQVGEGNSYGHPHDEILYAFQKMGAKTYRTDLNGTVKVIADGTNITVHPNTNSNSSSQTIPIPIQTENKNSNIKDANGDSVINTTPSQNPEHTVYVTPNGAKYHEEGCKHLGKNIRPLTLNEAISEGYEPCKGCH